MNYILQGNNHRCQLITLFNAFLHNYNQYPMYFSSLNFDDSSKEFKKFYKVFRENKKEIYDKLNLERIKYNEKKDKDLKTWINANLKKGNLIDFGAYIREPHSFLIADYDKKYDTYMCINARVFTNKTAVEWLPFPLLLKKYNKLKSYNNKSFNNLKINNINKTSGAIVFKK